MDVEIMGSGTPMPTPDRAGTSIHLDIGDDQILIDCGPGSVHRLIESGVAIDEIEHLFFTHHHIDHNSEFYHFLISSWSLGRDSLHIYGPRGTEDLIESFHTLFQEDLEYRKGLDYPASGIDGFEYTQTTAAMREETDTWRVTAHEVNHSIETYAYRFEEKTTGQECVFSGDTTMIDSLADFADGTDVLVQDACVAPLLDECPEESILWEHMHSPSLEERLSNLRTTHCTPEEAGKIASEAGVETLVLTHLLPYCDTEATRAAARSEFEGEVIVAEDRLSVAV